MRTSLWHAVLALAVITAGCGDDETEVRSAAPPPSAGAAPEVQLRVEHVGGFVPVEVALAAFPTLVVAEGTAWTPGAQILIYPAPAVPAVQSAPLDEDDLRALAERIDEAADLFDGTDFGQPPVADLPTTTIEAVVDGTERRLEVYALDADANAVDGALTDDQRRARQEVRRLIADLQAVVDATERPWEVGPTSGLRVSSIPVDPGAPVDDDGFDQGPPVPWPAGVPEPVTAPGSAFGCVAVSGDERDLLLEAAGPTNVLTTWELSSGPHRIALRPLFPGEPDCP